MCDGGCRGGDQGPLICQDGRLCRGVWGPGEAFSFGLGAEGARVVMDGAHPYDMLVDYRLAAGLA
jgi:hypothetical protein